MSQPMTDFGNRWFAVHTLPQREVQAHMHLRNQGFEVFLPQRLKTVSHARRRETRLRPLFPRYLFVQIDSCRTRWRSINGTVGVAHLVSFGDLPTPVPEGVVESLIEASDGAGVVRFETQLRAGQAVRLAAGPFAEQLGILSRLDGAGAVRVLLDIMGRRVEVKASRDFILPAA